VRLVLEQHQDATQTLQAEQQHIGWEEVLRKLTGRDINDVRSVPADMQIPLNSVSAAGRTAPEP
jgi:hypothetical protein